MTAAGTIADNCRCGAAFTTTSPYAINREIQHRQWLDAHAICRAQTQATCPLAVMK